MQYSVFMTRSRRGAMAAERIARHYGASVMVFKGEQVEFGSHASVRSIENGTIMRARMVYEISNKRKNALKCYLKAGEADPQFTLAFFDQGLMYKQLKKRDEALESYMKCVALDPDNAAAHNNMGLIYTDMRDFESAAREFEEILRIFPNHPTGLKNLERVRSKIGRGIRKFF